MRRNFDRYEINLTLSTQTYISGDSRYLHLSNPILFPAAIFFDNDR